MKRVASVLLVFGALAAVPVALAEETSPPTLGIANARAEGGVVAGGQPTREQLEQAAKAGFRTVVNLRGAGEPGSIADEKQLVEGLGMRYVAIPVAGEGDLSAENACRLAEVLDAAEARPALVHCASGNRVGALLALEAFHVEGASGERALERGRAMGLTSLDAVVKQQLATRVAAACPSP